MVIIVWNLAIVKTISICVIPLMDVFVDMDIQVYFKSTNSRISWLIMNYFF